MSDPTLGELASRYFELLSQKKAAETRLHTVESEISALAQVIIDNCDEHGVTSVTVGPGALRISESVVPHVTDWDQYYNYIHEHKFYHLLERRPSITGCRELFDQGTPVPGAVPFVRRVLRGKKS